MRTGTSREGAGATTPPTQQPRQSWAPQDGRLNEREEKGNRALPTSSQKCPVIVKGKEGGEEEEEEEDEDEERTCPSHLTRPPPFHHQHPPCLLQQQRTTGAQGGGPGPPPTPRHPFGGRPIFPPHADRSNPFLGTPPRLPLPRPPPITSFPFHPFVRPPTPNSRSGAQFQRGNQSRVSTQQQQQHQTPVVYSRGYSPSWPAVTATPLSHVVPNPGASGGWRPLMRGSCPPQSLSTLSRGIRPQQHQHHHHQTLRISKWVNPIPPDPDDGQQQTGEQELATKMLQIQSKRFYIDVKQNRRGRFMKVAEIGADGRRNQVFLALSTAAEFRDHLSVFSEFYSNLGPPNPDTLAEDGKLKSETMVKDNRRYYLDLKENSRGRFLRVSQTIARGGPRCQIAIPAQGMIEFRDALQELLEEFGTDDGGYKGELPEGRHMRVENKNFYFDIGQNNRGIYMRISEVKTNFRTAITIPEKSWSRFRDIFADYVDKMKEGAEKGAAPSSSSSAAAAAAESNK